MNSSTKQAIRDAFTLAAPSYDRVGPAFFQTFGQRLVELADVRPGMNVLDVGCGAGAALLPAAEATGPSGRVLGVDLTPGMVERAREAAAQRGLSQVEVRVADAEEPPGPPCHVGSGPRRARAALPARRRWRAGRLPPSPAPGPLILCTNRAARAGATHKPKARPPKGAGRGVGRRASGEPEQWEALRRRR